MSTHRREWINRRGQSGAELAIDQIIDRQPQVGEQIHQFADDLIEDSPYQARQSFSDESVEDLAQGMREAGFQGVLIVRPHSDPNKRRRGIVQLVYGHRRRVAWRRVCVERGECCTLPVVAREISDEQMLTIGAQENLQRQDLDPIEEAQIVAWHERLFFEKNQAEIGALLGKSSDWVSTRSRIHKLPDALKDRLRQRPRAIKQLLELNALYQHNPHLANDLADRVVRQHLTFDALRALIDHQSNDSQERSAREKQHNRRAGATSVQDITSSDATQPITTIHQTHSGRPTKMPGGRAIAIPSASQSPLAASDQSIVAPVDSGYSPNPPKVLALLQEAAAALADIESHAHLLKPNADIDQLVDAAASSVEKLRADRLRRALHGHPHEHNHIYQLVGTEIDEVLITLLSQHSVAIKLQSAQTEGISIRLVLCLLASNVGAVRAPQSTPELFIAVAGAGNATTPADAEVSAEWTRQRLKLQHRPAALVVALLTDLAKGIQHLQRGKR
jgi:ParB family chromosome partitioning protein